MFVFMPHVFIFANGHLPDANAARHLIGADDVIVAADGGTLHALALGFVPNTVIGDLDSLRAEDCDTLEAGGVNIHRYPRDKDQTDLELALAYCLENWADPVTIVGAGGGRLDQTLGNLSLLADPRLVGRDIRIDDGVEEVFFTRDLSRIHGTPGDIVSLIPWGENVLGVSTRGLRWPLDGETLFSCKTRGISNELVSQSASVSIQSGLLLIVHSRQHVNFHDGKTG
jgi:thiamine pyrophosphokinase